MQQRISIYLYHVNLPTDKDDGHLSENLLGFTAGESPTKERTSKNQQRV
jgi:hypothetical protein